MADEELAPERELDPETVPEEVAETHTDDTPDPIASLASKMGWVPQDQYRGPAEDWKPADEFILTGHEIKRNLSKDLRGMREQVERVGQATSRLMEERLAERDAHWRKIHESAVDEGNLVLAKRANDELVKIATEVQTQPARSSEPPETADFKARNADWFGKDRLATARAMEIAQKLADLGDDVPTQLRETERAIRKEFPELFKAPAKAAPQTQTGQSRNPVTTSRAKGFNDMPAESQKMAREYETRHGIKPEEFAKSYWAEQAKRRVG